jgi:predicted NUDIX family phosphoesterase
MTNALEERQIATLERKAEQVLRLKRKTLPRRPIVIEFAGSPKSGKSSCISSLDIFLRRNDFKTRVLTERASVCPIENKFDPLFNIWNGCAALNQLSELISNRPREYDVIIMDRGFFDTLSWLVWQEDRHYLRADDAKAFAHFFTAPRFRMMVDVVINFESSPETSLDREYKNLLTRREGSVMRKSVLSGYRAAARKAEGRFSSLFRKVTHFNTDDKDQNLVSFEVTQLTLEQLREVAKERIGYVQKAELKKLNLGELFKFDKIANLVSGQLGFGDRGDVESDADQVQLIPIAMIKDAERFEFLVARKRKEGTSRKSAEQGKILLYFGGHVREEDKTLFRKPTGLDVLKQCIYREVKEELGFDVRVDDTSPLCIWIQDGTRSEQHIAVVFCVERDLDYTSVQIDEREFVLLTKKEKYGTGARIDAKGILSNISRIDQWSKAALKEKFSAELEQAAPQGSFWSDG